MMFGNKFKFTYFKVEKRDGGDILITINDPEIVRHISECLFFALY